uniref:RNase H type-1 domain-containing protein n=1 Tax=Aegilops tauschii subsp. strangulata TaxID=200361 RepID=A0A453MWJ5_AEGTS
MILQDRDGQVISWHAGGCSTTLTRLRPSWMHTRSRLVPSSIELESDCSEAVTLLNGVTPDRSKYVHVVKEIRALNEAEHPVKLASISRTQNYASHGMSAVGRGQQLTACWLGNFPLEIGGAIQSNCNSMVSQ